MYLESPNNDVATESRIRWISRVILMIITVILLRLFILQIIHGNDYSSMAENNRIRLIRTSGAYHHFGYGAFAAE